MTWTTTGDVMTAEGFYSRQYRVEPENGRWRAHADRNSRMFATVEDAKQWCEYEEREMRKG